MSCSDARTLQPTSMERQLGIAWTSNQISQLVPCREQIVSASQQKVELMISCFKGVKLNNLTREKNAFTISRWRKISCSSRFGFSPSMFLTNESSASKNWGFEMMNGADTQGYLVKRQKSRITVGIGQRTETN